MHDFSVRKPNQIGVRRAGEKRRLVLQIKYFLTCVVSVQKRDRV